MALIKTARMKLAESVADRMTDFLANNPSYYGNHPEKIPTRDQWNTFFYNDPNLENSDKYIIKIAETVQAKVRKGLRFLND